MSHFLKVRVLKLVADIEKLHKETEVLIDDVIEQSMLDLENEMLEDLIDALDTIEIIADTHGINVATKVWED